MNKTLKTLALLAEGVCVWGGGVRVGQRLTVSFSKSRKVLQPVEDVTWMFVTSFLALQPSRNGNLLFGEV